MPVMLPIRLLPALLLFVAAPVVAVAESPMPDPIAPAVIGRPLDQLRPARPARAKPAAEKPSASKQATVPRTAAATRISRQLEFPTPRGAVPAAAVQEAPGGQRAAKQALDDRADPRTPLGDVGTGTRFARKPLAPGAYFGDRHRAAVRKYYEEHPVPGAPANWKIGEPVPRGARVREVPAALLPSLPALPPGHRYMQLAGEVVLVAESGMVVDGIDRAAR